jgi:hypothetical protein
MHVLTARSAGFGSSVNQKSGEFVYESFVVGPLTDAVAEALFRQKAGLIERAQEVAEGLRDSDK